MNIQFRDTNNLWEGALESPAKTYRGIDRRIEI